MKNILLAIAASTALISAPAIAADLGRPITKAPMVAAAPYYNWSGFYIGVHGGGAWSDNEWQFALTPGVSTNHSGEGGFFGGQIGFNYQFPASGFVLGVELDGAWADISGSTACPNPAFNCSHQIDGLASLRGRLGWAVGPALIYGTAGGGFAAVNYQATTAATGALFGTGFNQDAWGWTAGAGVEFSIFGNWSAKLEYLHYDLERATAPAGALGVGPADVRIRIDTVKAGLNYRFNWGAPLMASY
jgi:outer membrane immunogenic protein